MLIPGGKGFSIDAKAYTRYRKLIIGAIETLQDVSDRREVEEALRESMQRLGERVKELKCLHAMANLIEKHGSSLGEIFQGTADLILAVMQYPEIAYARITLEGEEFKTSKHEETRWRQVADIISHGEQISRLEVGYLKEKLEALLLIFLTSGFAISWF